MSRLPAHRPPTHPGEMLKEEFLEPLGITQTEFAKAIGISYVRLNEVINGRRGLTPDTALRFEKALGASAGFWLGLQQDWELYEALHSKKAREIAKIRRIAGGTNVPVRRRAG
jgi:addiction module HigA family antidote